MTAAESYYGRPVLKPPVWKVPDVPLYLYLGGLAGASSTMALLADLTGRDRLAGAGRLAAAVGATASVGALVHDLGRPTRFLNMLRVFKPTSPLSVGSWILAPFSALSGAAAASELTGRLPGAGRAAAAIAGAIAPAMTTYTAVLLADTAVPGWHAVYRELPFVFAGSAVSSAGAVGMLAAPEESAPARRMAIAGSVLELVAARRMHRGAGLVGEVYQQGRASAVLRAARTLTCLGLGAAVLAGRSRTARVASGLCLNAAAAATRYGIFEAGRASARDPRYTVMPQRTS
ncbi:Polysulphide reductase, NrfD [Saccharopolyspora antimicrobica]|uniref:Polysulfide reductase NrfD n=1 Tax=Saccharopolyspora antimicrobica TaxID=455193 RepID=A0A1I4R4N0_9PSEU|nr:NrfD/PsrC family molybdoenzyme membrane anchor subunit [Saccharopolyspora antimicrobica]RKT88170.1 polysulfide reductase NrfD [Saccharopolyspora antimicrobica]SFM47242.1 Polysulphide reductase, NrfD [Saccharopolyspora antimicrobica]